MTSRQNKNLIELGRDSLQSAEQAASYEWLVTNGIGGFATGTVSGQLTRRYQGLLVAALQPPLGRTLLVNRLDETITVPTSAGEQTIDLATTAWGPHNTTGNGHHHINRFWLDGTVPTWEYAIGDTILQKRIWMEQSENTTYVQYRRIAGNRPVSFSAKLFANYRDYHGTTSAGDWQMSIVPCKNGRGIEINAFGGATPFYAIVNHGIIKPTHVWYNNHYLATENYRGLSDREDHLKAGIIEAELTDDKPLTIVLSTNPSPKTDGDMAYRRQKKHENKLTTNASPKTAQLHLAADQFIVSRPTADDPNGKSIIAGYPWFGDWGRDTMISLRGLTLTTGRTEIARKILLTYGKYVNRGMIPNRFPDSGEPPEYNTIDATL